MNSAPQVQTAEISDADLDTVSGGVSPQLSLNVGTTTLSSTDLLSQVDSVQGQALGTLGVLPHQVGANVSF